VGPRISRQRIMGTHGGRRAGAGRPIGSGRYKGEATRVVRIPESLVSAAAAELADYAESKLLAVRRTSKLSRDGAAPSRAVSGAGESRRLLPEGGGYHAVDLAPTFLHTVNTSDMGSAGIARGDQVVVVRGVTPANGDIVMAMLGGDSLAVRRFRHERRQQILTSEPTTANPSKHVLDSSAGDVIWGVVSGVVHSIRKPQPGALPKRRPAGGS
jgi:DNA polymerase V